MGTGVTLDVIDTRYGISLEILIWNFARNSEMEFLYEIQAEG